MIPPNAFAPVAAEADDLPDAPFPPRLVEDSLRSLARAAKARQLYLPNNPIYQRSLDALRDAFAPLWEHTTELVLQISESEFRWLGRVVHHDTSPSESLPWTCYKDGLRELTIGQGFEEEEALILLDVLQRARKASPEDDDLLTLLWEQEFAFLRYRFIDVAIDGAEPILPSEHAGAERQISMDELRREAEPEPERPGIVSARDLDATLHFLDEHEIEYLRGEVQKDQDHNVRRNVLTIVLDIMELQRDPPSVREECCGILEQLLPQLLAAGDYGSVAYLLREASDVAQRIADLPAALQERLLRLPESLSGPGVLAQLVQALDEAVVLPPQEELDALFAQLRPGTLGLVLALLGEAHGSAVRTALENAAARLAASNTGELLRLIISDDPVIAAEAIRRAADLKTPAAVGQLAKVLTSDVVSLRREAAQALAAVGSPGAMRALEEALDDDDRDVRVTAVRAMGVHGHRGAFDKIDAVVMGRALRDADLTEKMAYFEVYGSLAGATGIERLDALLNGRSSLLRRRVEPEVRACAALALGKIGTSEALEVLRRAAGDKDARVRSAINRAFRGEGA